MSAQQSRVLVAMDNGRGVTIIKLTDARMYKDQKYAWIERGWYITYPEGDSSLPDNRHGCWVLVLLIPVNLDDPNQLPATRRPVR